MPSTILEQRPESLKISKQLSLRLERFASAAGFRSRDSYAAFLIKSVLDELEFSDDHRVSPRWSGGDEPADFSAEELQQIKEELQPLIQISC
jgi:hypothetical protein